MGRSRPPGRGPRLRQLPDGRPLGDQLSPVPAIMAGPRHQLEVGTSSPSRFRNAVVFAKEAATSTCCPTPASDGHRCRWMKEDYAIAGIDQADADTRIERLFEAIDIVQGMWSGEGSSPPRQALQRPEVDGRPAPVSEIPILIGGGGQEVPRWPRGRPHRRSGPEDRRPVHQPEVDGHGGGRRRRPGDGLDEEAAGDRLDDRVAVQVFVTAVTDDPAPIAENLSTAFGLPPEVVAQAPYFQLGTIDSIVRTSRACASAGASATSPSSRTPRPRSRRSWSAWPAPDQRRRRPLASCAYHSPRRLTRITARPSGRTRSCREVHR